MKQNICDLNKCTGCMACLNICKKDAIVTVENPLGFKYPVINIEKCNECGLCFKICPNNNFIPKNFPVECYALQKVCDKNTASGGAATTLSELIIKKGGVVYGCTGEDINHVRHIRVDSLERLEILKGSKYVQSDIGRIFREIKEDLRDKKEVLFIGTPCQVAGLRAYLIKDYERLYTIDLVCHGVPSQKLLNDGLSIYSNMRKHFNFVGFRYKNPQNKGELGVDYGMYYKDGEILKKIPWYRDPYMTGFMTNLFFRDSCYICPYAYCIRVGDFTISDFWGLNNKNIGDLDIKNGISAVLLNSKKAQILFDSLINQHSSNLKIVRRTVQEAIMGNGQLQIPSRQNKNAELFKVLYPKKDLKKSVNHCASTSVLKFLLKQLVCKTLFFFHR